ncbi:TetR/AcrR family transcriptional regulator [Xanthobacter sp. V4C-4]|uniref:TetR/AcrR family transcriptional regulator n=1 Tax=Xanthobacter cornucopiae TaxID=3119924 RepID=UPI003726694A
MRRARPVKAPATLENASNPAPGLRRPGRPKAAPDAVQRAAIVAGAHHLFVCAGYGGTTMDGVAAECRISKRTLYRFFPGKAELFAAVVEAHRHSMLALPGDHAHLPLDRALEAIFRIDISPEEDRARRALLRLVVSEGARHPELAEIVERAGAERARADLAAWLAAAAADGRLVLDDASAMARILMDMVFGAVLPQAGGAVHWPEAEAEAQRSHIRRCIRLFLHGAARRP